MNVLLEEGKILKLTVEVSRSLSKLNKKPSIVRQYGFVHANFFHITKNLPGGIKCFLQDWKNFNHSYIMLD